MRFTSLATVGFAVMTLVATGAGQEPSRVYPPGDGVTVPVIVREVKPEYTSEARKARIQGTVTLDVVVVEDGTVGEVKVTRSLDEEYGLDEQAVKAVKQWRFKPGAKDGKAVAVRVSIEMTFTLKQKEPAGMAPSRPSALEPSALIYCFFLVTV